MVGGYWCLIGMIVFVQKWRPSMDYNRQSREQSITACTLTGAEWSTVPAIYGSFLVIAWLAVGFPGFRNWSTSRNCTAAQFLTRLDATHAWPQLFDFQWQDQPWSTLRCLKDVKVRMSVVGTFSFWNKLMICSGWSLGIVVAPESACRERTVLSHEIPRTSSLDAHILQQALNSVGFIVPRSLLADR